MRRGDDRGVTVQIGAILLLAILFSALVLYQINVVPAENQEREFTHHERVTGDLVELRNAIRDIDSGRSVAVALGTQYEPRTFTVNPPDPTGTIETRPASENVTITGTDVTNLDLETNSLVYRPDYNEYDGPATVLEHTLLYNDFGSATVSVEDPAVFDGNRLVIPIVDGELSRTTSRTVSVDTTVLEGPATESPGENVTVTLPTDAPELWITALEDRAGVTAENETAAVELELDERYDITVACIGVGETSASTCNLEAFGNDSESGTDETDAGSGTGRLPGPKVTALDLTDERDRVNVTATFDNRGRTEPGNTIGARGGVPIVDARWYLAENESVAGDLAFATADSAADDPPLVRTAADTIATDELEPGNYTVVVEAMDTRGVWTNTDRDGDGKTTSFEVDDASAGEPALKTQIRDATRNSNAAFEIAYRVTDVSEFDRVEIDVENVDDANGGPTTYREENDAGTLSYGPDGGTAGDTYEFRFRVYDSTGELTELYTETTTVANGESPPGDDLGRDSDPELVEFSVTNDERNTNNRFTVDYEVDNSGGEFQEVRAEFDNIQRNWADGTKRSTDEPTGTIVYPEPDSYQGGVNGDTYEITVEVYNRDGIPVDSGTVTIEAGSNDVVTRFTRS